MKCSPEVMWEDIGQKVEKKTQMDEIFIVW